MLWRSIFRKNVDGLASSRKNSVTVVISGDVALQVVPSYDDMKVRYRSNLHEMYRKYFQSLEQKNLMRNCT